MESYYKLANQHIESIRGNYTTYHEFVTNNPWKYSTELVSRLNPDFDLNVGKLINASLTLGFKAKEITLPDDRIAYFFHRAVYQAVYHNILLP